MGLQCLPVLFSNFETRVPDPNLVLGDTDLDFSLMQIQLHYLNKYGMEPEQI